MEKSKKFYGSVTFCNVDALKIFNEMTVDNQKNQEIFQIVEQAVSLFFSVIQDYFSEKT